MRGGGGGVVKEMEFKQEPVHNIWRQIAHLKSGRKWNFLNAGLYLVSLAAVFGCHATLPQALRDIQKTAARETRLCLNETSFIEDDDLRLVQIALN